MCQFYKKELYLYRVCRVVIVQSVQSCICTECRSDAFGDVFSSKLENFILSEDKMGVRGDVKKVIVLG